MQASSVHSGPRRLTYTWDFLSNSSFPPIPTLLQATENLSLGGGAHRRSAALAEIGLLGLDVVDTLGEDGGVLGLVYD